MSKNLGLPPTETEITNDFSYDVPLLGSGMANSRVTIRNLDQDKGTEYLGSFVSHDFDSIMKYSNGDVKQLNFSSASAIGYLQSYTPLILHYDFEATVTLGLWDAWNQLETRLTYSNTSGEITVTTPVGESPEVFLVKAKHTVFQPNTTFRYVEGLLQFGKSDPKPDYCDRLCCIKQRIAELLYLACDFNNSYLMYLQIP